MHNSSRHVHVPTDMQGYAAMLSAIRLMAYNNPAAIGAAAWSGAIGMLLHGMKLTQFPSIWTSLYISTDSAAVA